MINWLSELIYAKYIENARDYGLNDHDEKIFTYRYSSDEQPKTGHPPSRVSTKRRAGTPHERSLPTPITRPSSKWSNSHLSEPAGHELVRSESWERHRPSSPNSDTRMSTDTTTAFHTALLSRPSSPITDTSMSSDTATFYTALLSYPASPKTDTSISTDTATKFTKH